MLYFTGEVFRRLANQNRGHIRVMLEFAFNHNTTLRLWNVSDDLVTLSKNICHYAVHGSSNTKVIWYLRSLSIGAGNYICSISNCRALVECSPPPVDVPEN